MAVFIVALAAAVEIEFVPSSAKNGCWSSSEAVGRDSSLISNVLCRKFEASDEMSLGRTGADSLPIYPMISYVTERRYPRRDLPGTLLGADSTLAMGAHPSTSRLPDIPHSRYQPWRNAQSA